MRTRTSEVLTLGVLVPIILLTPSQVLSQPTDEPIASSFELERNQIVLPVWIDGKGPFYVLLDTAGSPSAVDLATALDLGFPVDTTLSGEASGAGGERVRIFAAELPAVEIGGVAFGDLDAVALDLSRISARMGHPILGILGYGLLEGRIVQIDYPGRTVRFFAAPPETQGWRIPLVFLEDDFQPLVDMTVNGRPIRVTVDTGSSLALEVYPAGVEQAGLESIASRAVGDTTAIGARGNIEVPKAAVEAVGIGPFEVHDVEVAFTERERYEEGREGNLGNGILRHFVVTLDYPGKSLTFERPSQ